MSGGGYISASSNGRTSASDAEDVSSILSAGTSAERVRAVSRFSFSDSHFFYAH